MNGDLSLPAHTHTHSITGIPRSRVCPHGHTSTQRFLAASLIPLCLAGEPPAHIGRTQGDGLCDSCSRNLGLPSCDSCSLYRAVQSCTKLYRAVQSRTDHLHIIFNLNKQYRQPFFNLCYKCFCFVVVVSIVN